MGNKMNCRTHSVWADIVLVLCDVPIEISDNVNISVVPHLPVFIGYQRTTEGLTFNNDLLSPARTYRSGEDNVWPSIVVLNIVSKD